MSDDDEGLGVLAAFLGTEGIFNGVPRPVRILDSSRHPCSEPRSSHPYLLDQLCEPLHDQAGNSGRERRFSGMLHPQARKPTAVDLFAGAGGASEGLKQAGFIVLGAIENDSSAVATYQANHKHTYVDNGDIRSVDAEAFRRELGVRKGRLTLLKACPPCQGYSSLNRSGADDPRNDLVCEVLRFVDAFGPKVVLVENVPRLRTDPRLERLVWDLGTRGYAVRDFTLDARDFGVPQRRRRYILLAARGRAARRLPDDPRRHLCWLKAMGPSLRDVFTRAMTIINDELQQERHLSRDVMRRIAAIPINGDRRDLPPDLVLPCHRNMMANALAAYGRIKLDDDAPTMTTRCTSPSCGSFIHPTENRPINLREASLIQTFPADYRFVGSHSHVERMIGNAVPVRMARGLGEIVRAIM